MGASCWNYVVDFQEDVDAALTALRQQVFARGEYLDPAQQLETALPHMHKLAPKAIVDGYRRTLSAWKANPPQDIDDLHDRAAESGTHSILDVERIASKSGFGNVCPLGPERTVALTGSAQPTVEQVLKVAYDIYEQLERWQGVYVVAYEQGQPRSIVFLGVSGN